MSKYTGPTTTLPQVSMDDTIYAYNLPLDSGFLNVVCTDGAGHGGSNQPAINQRINALWEDAGPAPLPYGDPNYTPSASWINLCSAYRNWYDNRGGPHHGDAPPHTKHHG